KTIDAGIRADAANDPSGLMFAVKAMLLAGRRDHQKAEEMISRSAERGRGFGHFHHTAYAIACAYATMRRPTESVAFLRTASDDGFPNYPLFANDKILDP